MKYIPNILTIIRICGAIALLFLEPFTPVFYTTFIVCGFTDVLDGTIARIAHCESSVGATLDSAADLLLYAAMVIKVLPELIYGLRFWVWCYVIAIILLRVVSYIYVAAKYHRFASVHTYMNKLTGIMTFLIPLMIKQSFFHVFSIIGCTVAAIATVEELLIQILGKSDAPPTRQSIFLPDAQEIKSEMK